MKKFNLLNRFILLLYRIMQLLLRFFGINAFLYRSEERQFEITLGLKIYSVLICLLMGFVNVLGALHWVVAIKLQRTELLTKTLLRNDARMLISFLARFYQTVYEKELISLLNELLEVCVEIRALARHPNFFRLPHLILFLVALQSLFRSMSSITLSAPGGQKNKLIIIGIAWGSICLMAIFIVTVTVVILLFIGLIACYDELHRCTRRISNDVRALRMAQVMESGQRLVLVEQLRGIMLQLIAVRSRMFSLTVRIIKYFRFHLLMAIVYWIGHEVMVFSADPKDGEGMALYNVSIGLLNLAFYCSIFEIFMWKSQLSKSFWHFHLLNYNKDFDRTVDELIHRELLEKISVNAYGIRLDMRLFCKILLLTFAYFLMHFVYKKM